MDLNSFHVEKDIILQLYQTPFYLYLIIEFIRGCIKEEFIKYSVFKKLFMCKSGISLLLKPTSNRQKIIRHYIHC